MTTATTPDPAARITGDSSLGRSSLLMASGTAVSRALGLVRNILMVGAIGATGFAANSFDIANKIPSVLNAIISTGMFATVLVPAVLRAYQSKNPQEHLNKLLTLGAALMLAITAVLSAGATLFVSLMGGGHWTGAQRSLAIAFALWCIPQLFFYGLYMLLGQVLNAHKVFGPYMWAPALNNVISILGWGIYLLIYGPFNPSITDDPSTWTPTKIALFAGTATLGIAAQALILLWPMYRAGIRWRMQWGVRGIGLRVTGAVALWTLLSSFVAQISTVVTTRIAADAEGASQTGEGLVIAGNAAYSQAMTLYILPHSLITVSIATALFTNLSTAARAKDWATMRNELNRGMRTVGVFTVFATLVFFVLSIPITRALVPTLGADEVVVVAQVLCAMALGLVPLGAMVLLPLAYYALEDGRSVFYLRLITTGALVGLALLARAILDPQWWVVGIGVAMSLSNLLAFAVRLRGLRKHIGSLQLGNIIQVHVRCLLAAGVSGFLAWLLLRLYGDLAQARWLTAVGIVSLLGTFMTVAYLVLLKVLRVRELDTMLSVLPIDRLRRVKSGT